MADTSHPQVAGYIWTLAIQTDVILPLICDVIYANQNITFILQDLVAYILDFFNSHLTMAGPTLVLKVLK